MGNNNMNHYVNSIAIGNPTQLNPQQQQYLFQQQMNQQNMHQKNMQSQAFDDIVSLGDLSTTEDLTGDLDNTNLYIKGIYTLYRLYIINNNNN